MSKNTKNNVSGGGGKQRPTQDAPVTEKKKKSK